MTTPVRGFAYVDLVLICIFVAISILWLSAGWFIPAGCFVVIAFCWFILATTRRV